MPLMLLHDDDNNNNNNKYHTHTHTHTHTQNIEHAIIILFKNKSMFKHAYYYY